MNNSIDFNILLEYLSYIKKKAGLSSLLFYFKIQLINAPIIGIPNHIKNNLIISLIVYSSLTSNLIFQIL